MVFNGRTTTWNKITPIQYLKKLLLSIYNYTFDIVILQGIYYNNSITAKAELLKEGIFFLIHLFARDVGFSNEKVGNRKNQVHFYYISFKS